jgi:hypothetical protein
MRSVVWSEDPRFNGPHDCPKCGEQSEWTAVRDDSDRRTVRVECSGDCEPYEEPYSRLRDMPHFNR